MSKERVLDEMGRREVDVLILGREGNARAVSGAHRLFLAGERAFSPGCVVVAETGAVHVLSVTDFGVPADAHLYPPSWNPATLVGRVAALPGVRSAKRVGVDGITPLFEALLTAAVPDASLVDGEAIMRAARRIKSPDEVDHLRAAAAVARSTMAVALNGVARGLDDSGVVALAMEAMAAEGTTTAAFEPRISRAGQRVTVAVGVLRDGWEADVTRTAPEVDRPAELVAAIARCHPGVAVADVGADVHGVGCGYEALPADERLEPGMVLSVSVAGAGDTVLVTEDAPEVL
ncbi:MAG: aminopeptidase P family N-terminal domain-containing protein [Acidimicrobiia bacterium]|nr:aminopeptidase P family N-terminal domain-containing protein [Acidimicrobiia bacterium]